MRASGRSCTRVLVGNPFAAYGGYGNRYKRRHWYSPPRLPAGGHYPACSGIGPRDIAGMWDKAQAKNRAGWLAVTWGCGKPVMFVWQSTQAIFSVPCTETSNAPRIDRNGNRLPPI